MKDDLPDPRQLSIDLGDEEASAREMRDVALTAMWVFGTGIMFIEDARNRGVCYHTIPLAEAFIAQNAPRRCGG